MPKELKQKKSQVTLVSWNKQPEGGMGSPLLRWGRLASDRNQEFPAPVGSEHFQCAALNWACGTPTERNMASASVCYPTQNLPVLPSHSPSLVPSIACGLNVRAYGFRNHGFGDFERVFGCKFYTC